MYKRQLLARRDKEIARQRHIQCQLILDGRLDRLFHQAYDGLIEKVGLRKRRIFKLENPLLPPLTPLPNKAYWYDPVARP